MLNQYPSDCKKGSEVEATPLPVIKGPMYKKKEVFIFFVTSGSHDTLKVTKLQCRWRSGSSPCPVYKFDLLSVPEPGRMLRAALFLQG